MPLLCSARLLLLCACVSASQPAGQLTGAHALGCPSLPRRKDTKRQKEERLKEHSKLVGRWSELSAQDHGWYLQHKGGLGPQQ